MMVTSYVNTLPLPWYMFSFLIMSHSVRPTWGGRFALVFCCCQIQHAFFCGFHDFFCCSACFWVCMRCCCILPVQSSQAASISAWVPTAASSSEDTRMAMGQNPKPVPPMNIRFTPTTKIGSKMGGEPPNFDVHQGVPNQDSDPHAEKK